VRGALAVGLGLDGAEYAGAGGDPPPPENMAWALAPTW